MLQNQSKFINPTGLYDPSPNGYTHVVVAPTQGTTVYISGQGGEDENEKLSDDFATQLKQAFANLRVALSATGARPEDVVKVIRTFTRHQVYLIERFAFAFFKSVKLTLIRRRLYGNC